MLLSLRAAETSRCDHRRLATTLDHRDKVNSVLRDTITDHACAGKDAREVA